MKAGCCCSTDWEGEGGGMYRGEYCDEWLAVVTVVMGGGGGGGCTRESVVMNGWLLVQC